MRFKALLLLSAVVLSGCKTPRAGVAASVPVATPPAAEAPVSAAGDGGWGDSTSSPAPGADDGWGAPVPAAEVSDLPTGAAHEDAAAQAEKAGKLPEAEAHLLKAVEKHERDFGRNHPKVAHAYMKLAKLARKQGNHEKAKKFLAKAWSVLRVGIASANPLAGLGMDALAALYKGRGDHAAAAKVYEDSVRVMEEKEGGHPKLVQTYVDLAETYQDQGRHGEAIAIFNKAFKAGETTLGPDHPAMARALNGMASSYESRGEMAEAQKVLGKAADLQGAPVMARLPDLAEQYDRMAKNFAGQGKWREAARYYLKEISLLRIIGGDGAPTLIPIYAALADAYARLGRNADASARYKDALQIAEGNYGKMSPNLVSVLRKMSAFYTSVGRITETKATDARVAAIQAAAGDATDSAPATTSDDAAASTTDAAADGGWDADPAPSDSGW